MPGAISRGQPGSATNGAATNLPKRLSDSLLASHPKDAARALETVPAAETAALLAEAPPAVAAEVLGAMVPHGAAAVLQEAAPPLAARLVEGLPLHAGASLLRRLDPERRESLLAGMSPAHERGLRSLTSHAEQTAGALMDPEVLALPDDITARDARARVRDSAENARYNVYVVNREGHLVGVINLREIFQAGPSVPLRDVMATRVHQLGASADRRAIVQHPGWQKVHSLPVVDPDGRYLGAIRYGTLRRLETELLGSPDPATITADALGQLFSVGAGGVMKALTAGEDPGRRVQ